MSDTEQLRNERRLTALEIKQEKILQTLEEIKQDQKEMAKEISDIKMTFNKAGGIMIGFTMVGAAIGWVFSNVKQIFGLVGN